MKNRNLLNALIFVLYVGTTIAQSQHVIYSPPKYEKEWMQPGVHPDRIILNYGSDPKTTASVTWRTTPAIKTAYAEIAKATAAPKFWRNSKRFTAKTTLLDGSKVKGAGIAANYHSVTFSDLEPNTLYCYRVGDGEHWSEWIHFKTASETNDEFSFIYLGDAQDNIFELWSRLIRLGYQKAPKARFIVHTGDLVNDAHSEKQWEEWFKAGSFIHSMVASFPTPGNHEYAPMLKGEDDTLETLSIQWRRQFTLPENGPKEINELWETTYYMDFQGVRIISLNSNKYLKEQAVWLKRILTNNPNTWTIVTFHHPIYSNFEGPLYEKRREILKPIFEENHVDLVLQGHDHTYARGRTIPKEYNLTSVINKQDQSGTVYVVSIGGGKMVQLNKEGWEKWSAKKERDAENTQLAQVITVDHDTIHYKSFTATGDLYDAFDLIKNEKGSNKLIERKDEGIAACYFNNTIAYYDELPVNIKRDVLKKYPDFKIDKVNIRPNEKGGIYYQVVLENDDAELKLKIDEAGVILIEEKE